MESLVVIHLRLDESQGALQSLEIHTLPLGQSVQQIVSQGFEAAAPSRALCRVVFTSVEID